MDTRRVLIPSSPALSAHRRCPLGRPVLTHGSTEETDCRAAPAPSRESREGSPLACAGQWFEEIGEGPWTSALAHTSPLDTDRTRSARAPTSPAALASVPSGVVLVRVRVPAHPADPTTSMSKHVLGRWAGCCSPMGTRGGLIPSSPAPSAHRRCPLGRPWPLPMGLRGGVAPSSPVPSAHRPGNADHRATVLYSSTPG
jgi:hypothetical protein